VPGLKKETFQLYDNRKLQMIRRSGVECARSAHCFDGGISGAEGSSSAWIPSREKATVLPQAVCLHGFRTTSISRWKMPRSSGIRRRAFWVFGGE